MKFNNVKIFTLFLFAFVASDSGVIDGECKLVKQCNGDLEQRLANLENAVKVQKLENAQDKEKHMDEIKNLKEENNDAVFLRTY